MSSKPTEAPAEGAPPKKKGKLKPLLIYGVAGLVLVGGGVGAGLYAAGGSSHAAVPAEKDVPKLVPRGEGKHDEAAAEGGGHGGGGEEGGEGGGSGHGAPFPESAHGEPYDATYYTLEQPFTSNLQDSDGLIQVSLGVSTYYDSRVIDNLKRHEMPVRSAILMTLADQDPLAIATPAGKKALQATLTKAINGVLKQKEGFGGIDDVYFTSLIVQ